MLRRELGVFSAVMMGLGSIVGTGVFVSIGIAAGIAGPAVIVAIALAALLAVCNALSSAQLAASHAVSGGTYEYGYRYLSPRLGFSAGWMFLCAKIASAATAALGFAGYLLRITDNDGAELLTPIAFAAVVTLTVIVLSGIRRSNWVNVFIVTLTLTSLTTFILAGLPATIREGWVNLQPLLSDSDGSSSPLTRLLYATALMFVAYTGYGRIATLGEEVRQPRRTIPRAILLTLVLSSLLYVAVAAVAVGLVGADELGRATEATAAPLEAAAAKSGWPALRWIVAVGAMTAMLGVLLNLILGMSRVVLAMGRRGDLPAITARINASRSTPIAAVTLVGLLIAGLVLVGNVKTTWSFSAFTVLVYYAITNLAALRLSPPDRLFHRAFAWFGLVGCLFLAFWVEWQVWLTGLVLLGVGLLWHQFATRWRAPSRTSS
jgi:APA family basic amino acid/polyamine antiporter